MRIRSTKPEFWRSRRIASVDWDARLVLKGLESYVDDNGVGKDDLALICADVFPRDLSGNPTGTLQKVSEAISHLSGAGLLWRYEAEGTPLLYIAFWESVQRIEKPSKGRFPRPDGTWNYRDSEIREYSGNIPGTLPEPSGLEQGNRGTGEQGNSVRILTDSSSSEIANDPDADPRPEVIELCEHLAERVRANGHTATVGKRWHRACRLLIDIDHHTPEQIRSAIDWATADPFWSANVRSMQTLREKYTTLRAQASRPASRTRQQETNDQFDRAMARAEAREAGITQGAIA